MAAGALNRVQLGYLRALLVLGERGRCVSLQCLLSGMAVLQLDNVAVPNTPAKRAFGPRAKHRLCLTSLLQVPIVQSAFSPSATDIHNALRLIAAYQEHQQQGQGAFVFEGKMIDAPTVLQARNVLALAERLDKVV